MSLNATPSSERVHIGIFGKRNAGKSSLINAITGQNLAIVSKPKVQPQILFISYGAAAAGTSNDH